MKRPELLCPAKGIEELKTAVCYGADAVYVGGEAFSLRANARNFTDNEIAEGIAFAHERGSKVYVTANILAHDDDIEKAKEYFEEMKALRPDALIIADPGMYSLACEICPDIERHISTQANNTNTATFRFWGRQGASRVVAARELTLKELKVIRAGIPESLEMECFIHGAMCISYSGRCLLSNYLAGKDANHGECTHPCRWKYTLYGRNGSPEEGNLALEEETRPGEYFPVIENDRGTYIMNSRDLCMIEHIPELMDAGIDSFKVEGRMKTALYVACVARTYRKAIDDYLRSEDLYRSNLEWYREEIGKCTTRTFTTGFYFGKPGSDSQIYDSSTYVTEYVYLGHAEDISPDGSFILHQKNKF
ncbi:MAG: U32 family peptidase, partial [Lachnospiraceae bacterium]|nr:U32 family peptidase [Lachnospiraceae bacterium]